MDTQALSSANIARRAAQRVLGVFPERHRRGALSFIRMTLNSRLALLGMKAYTRTPLRPASAEHSEDRRLPGRLEQYFDAHTEGYGIWKWRHYFDAYERHFSRFVGKRVRILEIGIYSGGSLAMWRDYFGSDSEIYGVDIEEACRAYADECVGIFIGDQADRKFWRDLQQQLGTVDIVIDDGGHEPHQQMITLEESLRLLRPGGVYVCEDIHGTLNPFMSYINGFADGLNGADKRLDGEELGYKANAIQSAVHSIHHYPYLVVIEMRAGPMRELRAPRHGTQWQPFL